MPTGRRFVLALTAAVVAVTAFVPVGTRLAAAAADDFAPGTIEAAEAAAQRPWRPPSQRLPSEVPTDRYELAGGCYAMRSLDGDTWVMRDGDGYGALAPTLATAERFHLQATDLGRYLLFGSDRRLLAVAEGVVGEAASDFPDSAGCRWASPTTPHTNWRVVPSAN